MKNLITSLLILFFAQISLASTPFLQYEFGVQHNGDDLYVSLRLFDNSDISVEIRPIEEAGTQILVPELLWTSIDPLLFTDILSISKKLSQAAIETLNNHIVCELYVPYIWQVNHLSLATPYDETKETFAKTLEVVKGPEGCWVKNTVYFVDEENDQTAKNLKIKLLNWFQQSSLLKQATPFR